MRWFQRAINDVYKLTIEELDGQSVELVEIVRGPYKGTKYYYGIVQFVFPKDESGEIIEGSAPTLRYEYFAVNAKKDTTTKEFKDLVGDILVDMIQSQRLSDKFVPLNETYHED